MPNFRGKHFLGKKRPTISLKLFSTLSDSFSNPNPTKSPRNFQDGVVGLGIVAAMTDSTHTHQPICFAPSPRSTTPIPIVSFDKAKPNLGGAFISEKFGDLFENPTCVISNFGDSLIKKQFYFYDVRTKANVGEFKREFWSDDFLTNYHLCKKELQGLDIFMYRGEKAFCSSECRDKQITSDDDHKQTCGARNHFISPSLHSDVLPCRCCSQLFQQHRQLPLHDT